MKYKKAYSAKHILPAANKAVGRYRLGLKSWQKSWEEFISEKPVRQESVLNRRVV